MLNLGPFLRTNMLSLAFAKNPVEESLAKRGLVFLQHGLHPCLLIFVQKLHIKAWQYSDLPRMHRCSALGTGTQKTRQHLTWGFTNVNIYGRALGGTSHQLYQMFGYLKQYTQPAAPNDQWKDASATWLAWFLLWCSQRNSRRHGIKVTREPDLNTLLSWCQQSWQQAGDTTFTNGHSDFL